MQSRLSRILAKSGLNGPRTNPVSRPSQDKGSEEPVLDSVWRTSYQFFLHKPQGVY